MKRLWTDEDLYKRYGITPKQIAFIESLVAERPSDETGDLAAEDDE
jgi:hypothetical protein